MKNRVLDTPNLRKSVTPKMPSFEFLEDLLYIFAQTNLIVRKLILLLGCAILLGCDKFVVFDYYLRGEFDAVYCYIPEKGIPCKKDTAISFSAEELVLLHLKKDSEGQNYGRIDYGIENIDGLFRRWNCDTVSFFMFDSKVVENNTWEEVVQNYMVLQRYDFSKEDLARLNCRIFYPPTEEMSEIHMFPPYEKVKMR